MCSISYTEAQRNLKSVIDYVVNGQGSVLICRRSGGNAVLVSESAYNAMMETLHLLSSPANAAALARSIEQFRQGQTDKITPAKLFLPAPAKE